MAVLLQSAASQALPVSPAPEPAVRARITGDPGTWVTPRDYPPSAMRARIEGVVGFTLTIDAKGNVTDCAVTASSNTQALDEATCSLTRARAHFLPARDDKGRPVGDTFHSRVKWVLPEGGAVAAPLENAGVVQISYIVEADGAHTNCHIDRVEGAGNKAMQVGTTSCHDARSVRGFIDETGNSVRRKVTITQTIAVDPVP
jgi:TonB family protein